VVCAGSKRRLCGGGTICRYLDHLPLHRQGCVSLHGTYREDSRSFPQNFTRHKHMGARNAGKKSFSERSEHGTRFTKNNTPTTLYDGNVDTQNAYLCVARQKQTPCSQNSQARGQHQIFSDVQSTQWDHTRDSPRVHGRHAVHRLAHSKLSNLHRELQGG
jgi:hypothetical protein